MSGKTTTCMVPTMITITTKTTTALLASSIARTIHSASAFTWQLREIVWPASFKPAAVERYDGKTDPVEWLSLYKLAVCTLGGDTFVMANYLSMRLTPSIRSWLL